MKKIFLYAYDRINLGDDLFIHTIANRYPEVKFYLWSKKYNKKTFSSLPNVKVLAQDSLKTDIMNKLHPSLFPRYKSYMERKCDAVVYIGGSIFIEYENWEQILTWWDYEAKNRRFYILGANFGPYKTPAYRDKLAEILNNVEDICFRDKYSEIIFSDVSKVRYAPDILLSYEFPENVKTQKKIFISVIDCESRDCGMDKVSDKEELYINLLVNCIKKYVNDGYKVDLCSFCTIEKDMNTVMKIINRIDSNKIKSSVSVISYDGCNHNDVINSIAESELILASRFHAAVLGFAANKPVLPIIYSDKTLNILNDFEFQGKYLDIRTLNEDSYRETEDLDFAVQTIKNSDKLKEKSKEHFKMLDSLVNN